MKRNAVYGDSRNCSCIVSIYIHIFHCKFFNNFKIRKTWKRKLVTREYSERGAVGDLEGNLNRDPVTLGKFDRFFVKLT